jgi:DNA-binding beta-propeller fold protein YncE
MARIRPLQSRWEFSRRARQRRSSLLLATTLSTTLALTIGSASAQTTPPNFIEFESGQVRPLAISADKSTLFAVNTPDGTLEVFSITSNGLTQTAHVPVGMEPVAVAVRSSTEVWVVNHLSDSVSIVSLSGTPHVTKTLLVGDEPNDVVFAGNNGLAFISTAHRGQQRTDPSIANVPGAGDPQLTTPGVSRADVWVFDPNNLGATMGGTPKQIMSFFTDSPRALAVSPDGNTVYAAGFETGNQTTAINEERICPNFNTGTSCTLSDGSTAPGGHLGPATDNAGEQAPLVSMIVKFNNADGHWEDELGRDWDGSVRFSLPDTDVFAVDANKLTQTAAFAHVGTTLFNMATNPKTGDLYVTNYDSQNQVRFEDNTVSQGHTVTGNLCHTRITAINPSSQSVTPVVLNNTIDRTNIPGTANFNQTAFETAAAQSLETPLGLAVSSDGTKIFMAAFGSSEIGVFNAADIEGNTFNAATASANYIPVSGGGPSGVILDETRNQLYVLTRFNDAVNVISLANNAQTQSITLTNPEPSNIVQGRPMLYDARPFGSNGETSCASCHTFGDKDELAWDLGQPQETVKSNPITLNLANAEELAIGEKLFGTTALNGVGQAAVFHPMKGPMTTQTLKGLANSGAMHWRGDRSNGVFGENATNEHLSFDNFAVAFISLVGTQTQPTQAQMETFAGFMLNTQLPPNPVRNLDNSLTSAQQAGANFFFGNRPADGINLGALGGLILGQTAFTCDGCHADDPAAGQFGTSTNGSFEGIDQIFKIPQLRNMYTKVGMFGIPSVNFFNNIDSGTVGNQIRGFGFTNEGSVDTMFDFFHALVFNPLLNSGFPLIDPDTTRRNVEQFALAFDSDLAPIVGQQVTLNSTNSSNASARVTLLEQRAGAAFTSLVLGGNVTECDLVAKVVMNGTVQGFLFNPSAGNFTAANGGAISDASLRGLAATAGQEVTFTAVPPGSGARVAFSQ